MLDPKKVVDQMETEFQAGAESVRKALMDDDTYGYGVRVGAASRDAEIAELQAEIASLKESLILACEIREGTSMGEQRVLYWEQLQSKLAATETELAAAIVACKAKDEAIREGLETYKIPMTARIVEALAIQPDDSALEAIVKKAGEVMREKCIMGFLIRTHWYAEKGMRALPALTLEDLK